MVHVVKEIRRDVKKSYCNIQQKATDVQQFIMELICLRLYVRRWTKHASNSLCTGRHYAEFSSSWRSQGVQSTAMQLASPECYSGLILGLRPANERQRYFVTTSLIGWAQIWNQPWLLQWED